MSTHARHTARRGLRITATAAGVAAIGLGIAGPAFAAPAVPDLPQLPGADQLGSLPSTDAFTMAADSAQTAASNAMSTMTDLPGTFQMPEVPTAMPTDAAALPSLPDTSGIINANGTGVNGMTFNSEDPAAMLKNAPVPSLGSVADMGALPSLPSAPSLDSLGSLASNHSIDNSGL